MGRRHPSAIYWLCTLVACLVGLAGIYAAKAAGDLDHWTLVGAVLLAVMIWLAGLAAG